MCVEILLGQRAFFPVENFKSIHTPMLINTLVAFEIVPFQIYITPKQVLGGFKVFLCYQKIIFLKISGEFIRKYSPDIIIPFTGIYSNNSYGDVKV